MKKKAKRRYEYNYVKNRAERSSPDNIVSKTEIINRNLFGEDETLWKSPKELVRFLQVAEKNIDNEEAKDLASHLISVLNYYIGKVEGKRVDYPDGTAVYYPSELLRPYVFPKNIKDPTTALFNAIERCDITGVDIALKHGANPNAWGKYGNPCFVCAAHCRDKETESGLTGSDAQEEIAGLLNDAGADVNAKNSEGYTAIMLGAALEDPDLSDCVVSYLIFYFDADVNLAEESEGYTPLMLAVANGNYEAARVLDKNGADLEIRDRNGHTALFQAAMKGDERGVAHLLWRGADPDATDDFDGTPLMAVAAFNDDVECAELLIKNGANVDAQAVNGNTPLMRAAKEGSYNVAKLLIKVGANTELTNDKGQTAADLASNDKIKRLFKTVKPDTRYWNSLLFDSLEDNNYSMLKHWIEKGADPNAKDRHFVPLLIHVTKTNSDKLLDYVLEHGANVNATGFDDKTALMIAIERKNPYMIDVLFKHGADVNKANRDGETPLMLAAKIDSPDVVQELIDRGANVNAENKKRWTALTYADVNNSKASKKILLENGATEVEKEKRVKSLW